MTPHFNTDLFLQLQPICKGQFHYFDQLESTSDYAKKLVAEGAESGTLVLAEHQSGGRGRSGNVWISPAGEGLLFTLIIDPDVDKTLWNRFSLIAGVAMVRAIHKLCDDSISIQLKWPNDVYLNGKKCAGILTEIVANKLLIGIGINLTTKKFPTEISAKATSLLHEGIKLEREELLAAIISEIYKAGSLAGDNFHHIINAYNKLCMLTGNRIAFTSGPNRLEGRVSGIAEDGTLILDHGEGTIHYREAKDIILV